MKKGPLLILIAFCTCLLIAFVACEHQLEPRLQPTLSSIQINVFTPRCAVSGCHVPGGAGPMSLELGKSFSNIVDVSSVERSNLKRVNPKNANDSYLIKKLEGAPDILFDRMPQNGPPYLASEEVNVIRTWIYNGAQNN